MIKYSIIIPVYNLENYIEKTLDSLKRRSDDAEIIIVNDGSTDKSWSVIEKYVSDHDITDIQLLTQPNGGVSVARNTGIESAKGEYIIFIDGDDICSDRMLERLGEAISGTPELVVWRFDTADGQKNKVSQDPFAEREYSGVEFCKTLLNGKNRIRIGSFAINKNYLISHNLKFTEGCAICEDVEFMYKAILSAERVVTMDDVLYTYIKREGSAANTFDMRRFQAPRAIQRVYGYATLYCNNIIDEYIEDSLKYGLYITHCMHSFEACCRYLNTGQLRKEFLDHYFSECDDVEGFILKAKKKMKYRPDIYSQKRVTIFLFSRRLYVWYVCLKNRGNG